MGAHVVRLQTLSSDPASKLNHDKHQQGYRQSSRAGYGDPRRQAILAVGQGDRSCLPGYPGQHHPWFAPQIPVGFARPGFLPTRGLYKAVKFKDTGEESKELAKKIRDEKIKEEDFYEAFGEWLVNELEECTKVTALGGNRFRDKWGTPDVIGIREAKRSDIIKPPTEIIAAEIKLDPAGLITAFGQACAYKLFAHKSYIVVPQGSSDEDVARLDALCRIFGIGLVLFDPTDKETPDFSIRVRASREEPDMFYVNKYLKLVEDDLFG